MSIVFLILFMVITNLIVLPIMHSITHRSLFFGVIANALTAVLAVYAFNAFGLTEYLLIYVSILAVFSWYTYQAIRDGDYQRKKKMKMTSAVSSIVFLTVFFVYSLNLYNA